MKYTNNYNTTSNLTGLPLLEVRSIACGYNSGRVLADISFSVNRGEMIGILGPNGSGKTTLIRVISRVIKPLSGEVLFNGRRIADIDLKEFACRIAVIPQTMQINSMTVENFVMLGRIPHYKKFQFFETARDIKVAEEVLRLTEIFPIKNRCVSEISGGERQLVLIARALAQEPELLLLDEPTTYLDITHQVRIMDLIKKLNKEKGLTVITVMHDLNMAAEYCERLILFRNGCIYKSGTPEEVLKPNVIKDVYQTRVSVQRNPSSSKPCVFILSEYENPP